MLLRLYIFQIDFLLTTSALSLITIVDALVFFMKSMVYIQ